MSGMLTNSFRALVLFLAAANAQAVTVFGATVEFSFDDSLLGRFGRYSVVGDTLKFDANNFVAATNNPRSGQIVDQHAPEIRVQALRGRSLDRVKITEKGSFRISGNGDAAVAGSINVGDDSRPFDVDFDNEDGAIDDTWFVTQAFDRLGGFSTSINLHNKLFANVNDMVSASRITKSDVSIHVSTVPVPAAIWLLGSAILGIIGIGRRV